MPAPKRPSNISPPGGSYNYLGFDKKNNASAKKPRSPIAAELATQGHPFQAILHQGCGKPFAYTDPKTGRTTQRKNRCKYGKLCDRCAHIAGMQAKKNIHEMVAIVVQTEQHAIEGAADTLTTLQQQINLFVQQWDDTEKCPGRYSRLRKKLQADWLGLARQVRALRDTLSTQQTEEWIKRAKQDIDQASDIDMASIVSIAQAVGHALHQALADRQDYEIQHITLSLRTTAQDRASEYRFRLRITGFKEYTKSLLKHGALAAPGSGAIVSIHPQSHIHAHLFYYGPKIKKKRLKASWAAITGDSYQVEVDWALTDEHAERIIHYLYNLPSLEKVPASERVQFWKATRNMKRVTGYGVFATKTHHKLQQQVATATDVSQPEAQTEAEETYPSAAAVLRSVYPSNLMALPFHRQEARRLSKLIQRSIQHWAMMSHAPTEDDVVVLEKLLNIAEGHDAMRSAQWLHAAVDPSSPSEVPYVQQNAPTIPSPAHPSVSLPGRSIPVGWPPSPMPATDSHAAFPEPFYAAVDRVGYTRHRRFIPDAIPSGATHPLW